jgi:uroporphyrinogen-III synthase
MKTFEVSVEIVPLPISASALQILKRAASYDHVVFTSKNAQEVFEKTLRKLRAPIDSKKYLRVGPRYDLLKLDLRGKRILFPRSALAPYDVIHKLRARGVVVRTATLYTALGTKLSTVEKKYLLAGRFDQLYFKSPSGINGFLRQFSSRERSTIKNISTICIGPTTAQAAKKAGFKKIKDRAHAGSI